jgi:phage FluMu gp28-like protein
MAITVEAALEGRTIIWGAPVYDQVRICWGETKRAAGGVAQFKEGVMTAEFPTGGRIIYRSMDNADNVRGYTADGVVIDEAADVAESAWYEVLRAMLIDTGGWSWAIGTPKGQNWFWREFVNAEERPDSMAWFAPTLGVEITEAGLVRRPHPLENPFIPFSEMEQLYRTLPERTFRQEILAEFQGDSGSVFRNVRQAIDKGRAEAEEPKPDAEYYLGVDLARVEDFTVLSVMDEQHRQIYLERFNQISWERQIERIVAVSAHYNGAVVMLDSTGVGDPIFEAIQKRGLHVEGFKFTNENKERLIDSLAMGIEGGTVRLMDLPTQTNELLGYQYELTPSRNVRMAAPEGMHDDTVIALALADWAIAHPGGWWRSKSLLATLAKR